MIIGQVFRIGLASLGLLGLEAYTWFELMMGSGAKTGNLFLFMTDEVTHVLYICLAFGPFSLDNM